MKKNALSLLLALVLVLTAAAPVSASEAIEITSGDWTFLAEDGEATLVEYLGSDTDVVVPETIDGLPVTRLSDDHPDYDVFRNVQLTSVQLPGSLKHLSTGCFHSQESLTEVVIPDSITVIPYGCFSGCTNLKSVTLPETLTRIEMWAFSGCASLQTIELPGSLEVIEQMAFQNCTGLTEITIPCSAGFWSFHGCTGLEKVTFSGAGVGDLAFEGCTGLKEVILTDNVKALGEGAFANTGLTSIFIPASVTTMDYYAVGYTAEVNETGWLGKTDRMDHFVIFGFAGTAAEEYAERFHFPFVPEGEYAPIEGDFGEYAHWKFDPDTGKLSMWGYGSAYQYDHGEQPWYGLYAQITSVEISGELFDIPAIAFYRDFSSLSEVTVTAADCRLGQSAFAELENLETVTLSAGTSIGPHCFAGSALESIVLPAEETCTGQAAFKNCKNLKEVVFSPILEEINTQTFYGCTSLKEVDLPESTWIISYQAFAHSGLEAIEIPDNVVVFHGESFLGCGDLKYVKLPAGLTETYGSEFADCTSLSTVIMPEEMDAVFGQWVFKNCDSLTDISFHTAPVIGLNMYQGCDGLTELSIPEGVLDIQNNAFAGCLNLNYVTIPATVNAIGDQAFAACGRLKTVAFRGDAPAFSGNVFASDALTCYYPAGNGTWTADVMQNYGGTVTWLPYELLPFTDVPAGSFYYGCVGWALEKGITNGISATEFGSNLNCNRAQVVTFLWRAAGCPEPTAAEHPFVDVQAGSFYEKAVLWAVETGITTGTDERHFSPNASCNRAAVVTFLHRAAGSPTPLSQSHSFTDVPAGAFYEQAVLWALENKITNGISATQFGPTALCNRAQVVTFLNRTFPA